MIRIQLGVIGLGLVLLVYGGHKSIIAVGNMSPTQITYAEYCKQNVNAEWLVLDDCYIDYRFSCGIEHVEEKTKRVKKTEYFVAVLSSTEEVPTVKAFLVVEDRNKQALMREWWDVPIPQEEAWSERNAARIIEDNVQIKGLARTGLDLSSEDRNLIRSMVPDSDPNFKIIEPNKEPQGALGFLMLFGGLAIGGAGGAWLVTSIRGRKQQPPPPMPGRMPHPTGPGPQGPGMGPRPAQPPQGPGMGPRPAQPPQGPGMGPRPAQPPQGPGMGPRPAQRPQGPGMGPRPGQPPARQPSAPRIPNPPRRPGM